MFIIVPVSLVIDNPLIRNGFEIVELKNLFCSQYSKSIFQQGILNRFKFGYLDTYKKFINIKRNENKFNCSSNGLFIFVVARKKIIMQ